MYQTLKRF